MPTASRIDDSQGEHAPSRPLLLGAALLALLVLSVYSNSFPASFLSDDTAIVVNHPQVLNIDLPKIFTSDYWGPDVDSGLFRPLTILSFGLAHALWGPDATIQHWINLALHVLVVLLLFTVLEQYGIARRTAWLAAAIFAVHPIHTEVLNEAVGRAELLAAAGVLGALGAWRCSKRAIRWLILPAAYLAGLLSKENAIILLVWLPVLEAHRGGLTGGEWRKKLPRYGVLLGTTLLWMGWRVWGVVRIAPPDGYDPVYTPLAFLPFSDRILTALKLQGIYLRKLVLPYDLQGIYSGDHFFQPVHGLFSPEGAIVLVATVSFLCAVSWLCLKRRPLGLGLLLYTIAVLPASNLFFLAGVTFAERLLYLPSIGFSLALATLLAHPGTAFGTRWRTAAPVAILATLMALTLLRNPDYRSPQALWQRDVQQDPKNVLAWMFLATTYSDTHQTKAADASFQKMLSCAPDFHEGLLSYASFLTEQGRYPEAIQTVLNVARSAGTVYPAAFLLLGEAYVEVGAYSDALYWLEKTPSIFKKYGIYWEYRGRALERLGDKSGAIASYRRMGGYPKGSEIPLRLGNLLLQKGRVEEALEVLAEGIKINPSSAAAWNSLGVSQALTGNQQAARQAFGEAVRLSPQNLKYRENLRSSSQEPR